MSLLVERTIWWRSDLQCADLDPALTPFLNEAADLTDYASVFRYPDAPCDPDVEEAVRAL
jgi:hypothetical protein